MFNKFIRIIFSVFVCIFSFSCSRTGGQHIAVYVPGIIADSPTYADVVKGVQKAVNEWNMDNSDPVKLTVVEAGTTQSQWQPGITALAASGKYDVIISSNPSMPELCKPVAKDFPNQKFILLDAFCEDNAQISTVSYNQKYQSYLSGYMAGLSTKNNKVGLIAAQEYPVMNEILYPYFEKGAKKANPWCRTFFRVVGNWYDASKGAEITQALYNTGVDVVLPICGGASQGVISTAKENDMHIVWFDENGFKKAPGTIISCCMTKQDLAAKEATLEYLAGNTKWGTVRTVGFKEGYVSYFDKDESYIKYVDSSIREKMSKLIEDLQTGAVTVPASL